MSATSLIRITVLATAVALAAPAVYAAEDASMHEVYQAAEAGKFTEAQAMMDKVLRDHPNSAKAHFVEAELLGKQGRFAQARDELANAERLAPGLPFAKPAAVQSLRNLIAGAPTAPRHTSYAPQAAQAQAPAESHGGMPWGWLIVGAGLIGFIVFAVRFMGRRTTPTYSFNGPANSPAGGPSGNYANAPAGGYGGGYGGPQQPYGGPMAGGGIGSGIVGGLATGAAVGAGLAAGEALVHHFTDGDRGAVNNGGNTTVYQPAPQPDIDDERLRRDDMGGTDFGIADSGSWDSGTGGGGDDDSWN